MDRFDETSLNPYAAPKEAEQDAAAFSAVALPVGCFWHAYLYAHLASVTGAAAIIYSDSIIRESSSETVIEILVLIASFMGLIGMLFLMVFPIVFIVLVINSSSSPRYLVFAFFESLLNLFWFFMIVPAVLR